MTTDITREQVLFLYGFSENEAQAFCNQKTIVLPDDPHDEVLKRIAWEFLFSSFSIAISPRLTAKQQETGSRVVEKFQHFHRGAQAVIADVRDMGKKIIGNIIRNLTLLPQACAFSPFEQAFRGVPAVICGAGPSLEKSIPFLSELRQRALILAGGSALNALTHASIFPHFAAAIDPDPPAHLFRCQGAVESPLFYQNRVAHRLLKDCHGAKIWVPDNVSYPIEEWLMQRLGIDALPFEAGWNVATFSLQIAVAMGCNPIIITGVDLCHSKGKTYAAGVAMPQGTFTPVPLEEGKETKADFLLAAEWIEEFVAAHPETSFINASSGGLSLRGMKQVAPQDIALQPLPCDLEGKIYSLLVEGATLPPLEKVDRALQEFKENISSSLLLIERMVALLQKWYPEDASLKGEFILPEVEFEENPLYLFWLQPLWNIWQWAVCPPEKTDPYTFRLQRLLFFERALQAIQQE